MVADRAEDRDGDRYLGCRLGSSGHAVSPTCEEEGVVADRAKDRGGDRYLGCRLGSSGHAVSPTCEEGGSGGQ